MSSNPVRLQVLYRKYIAGTASVAELQEFWTLLRELSDNDVLSDELKRLWIDMKSKEENVAPQATGQRIIFRIFKSAKQQQVDFAKLHRGHVSWLRPAVSVAAVLLLVVAGWYLWRAIQLPPAPNSIAKKINPTGHNVVVLPDGSKVTLNIGSKLQFAPSFTKEARHVYLSGEAYFDVVKDEARPFYVHTGKYVTRVLGTVFNVSAYADNEQLAVTVTEGKVQVSEGKKVIALLLPSDQLVVTKATGMASLQHSDTTVVTRWTKEDLVFQNSSLQEAADVLQQRFGIAIRFENESLKKCAFTGAFFSSDGLEPIIDIITSVTGSGWRKDAESILILGKGCAY